MVEVFIRIVGGIKLLGLFPKTCNGFIASHDLGRGTRAYESDKVQALRYLMRYEDYEDDFCCGSIKYTLGLIYFYGDSSITSDRLKAYSLFESAALLGNETAQEYLQKVDASDKQKRKTEGGET
jgi:hypothetical protein